MKNWFSKLPSSFLHVVMLPRHEVETHCVKAKNVCLCIRNRKSIIREISYMYYQIRRLRSNGFHYGL